MPFKTRRFIMQMAVHYFFNTDFRLTFPIKFKFNFINWHESVEYSTELAINLNAEFNWFKCHILLQLIWQFD